MNDSLVLCDVARGVATITLNSSRNRNALSNALRTELFAHVESALEDPAVRVLVLTHAGEVFCAGADLSEQRNGTADAAESVAFSRILETLWHSPKPVVARLAGPARAGGVGLMAACDIAVAAESVTFAFTEVRLGVVPAMISATALRRMLPYAAHELFLTGETICVERAADIGLLNAYAPTERLDELVDKYVDMLLLGAPSALAATKAVLRGERRQPFDQELEAMLALSREHFGSDEGREGIAAFTEKRPPAWVPT
ncbi:enoyl-CoA hydratase-related protein [Mycobacterium syngnathidarum]